MVSRSSLKMDKETPLYLYLRESKIVNYLLYFYLSFLVPCWQITPKFSGLNQETIVVSHCLWIRNSGDTQLGGSELVSLMGWLSGLARAAVILSVTWARRSALKVAYSSGWQTAAGRRPRLLATESSPKHCLNVSQPGPSFPGARDTRENKAKSQCRLWPGLRRHRP